MLMRPAADPESSPVYYGRQMGLLVVEQSLAKCTIVVRDNEGFLLVVWEELEGEIPDMVGGFVVELDSMG